MISISTTFISFIYNLSYKLNLRIFYELSKHSMYQKVLFQNWLLPGVFPFVKSFTIKYTCAPHIMATSIIFKIDQNWYSLVDDSVTIINSFNKHV